MTNTTTEEQPDSNRPLVLGIDHVQIEVPAGGEELARAFYVGILGLQEVEIPPSAKGSFMWLAAGSQYLRFCLSADFRRAKIAHPGLLVDDIKTLRSRLEAAGYTLHQAGDSPSARIGMRDPFGNRLEFIEIFSRAKPENGDGE